MMRDQSLSQLAMEVGVQLRAQGLVLATAESCTGGWLSKVITEVAGSSAWFDCGFVTYSNASKVAMLGVDIHLLDQHGAVSIPVVEAMVTGVLARSCATLAVSISGIAGPEGGSVAKPVGTLCFGWGKKDQPPQSAICHFNGDRVQVRMQSVEFMLRKLLEL